MTDINREQYKWSREKDKAIIAYNQQNREFFSTVAGRGFLILPGFAYEMQNDLEYGVKSKLSEVNFAILSDSIERELKQMGVDYDLAFKNASIVWEMTKQGLLGMWEQEHADIKRGMEFTEEALLRAMVEVQARNAILMMAKVDIELQAEALRKQLAEVSDDSADYEVSLAQQKVLTATKKLDLIPILQQIVQAEMELITEKNALLVSKNTLVDLTGGLLQYEAELARVKLLHVAAEEDLIVAQEAVVALEQQLIALKLTAIPSMTALITAKESVIDSKDALVTAKEALVAAQATVETYKERVVVAKGNLVATEYLVFPYEQDLNVEMAKVANKKLTLVPIYAEIVGQLSLLSAALELQGENLVGIAAEHIAQANYKIAENLSRMTRATTMLEIEGLVNDIEIIRLEMAAIRGEGETAALRQEAVDIRAMADKEMSILSSIIDGGRTTNQTLISLKKNSIISDSASKILAINTQGSQDQTETYYINARQMDTLRDETQINLKKELTSTISHLLSM